MNDDWQKNLKAGDLAGIVSETYASIRRVERITPSGMVVLAPSAASEPGTKPTTFTTRGVELGQSSSWRGARLVPPDEAREAIAELRARRERGDLLRRINGVGWRDQPTETLRRVVAALDAKESDHGPV